MSLEDVAAFRAWATKLGCPQQALTSEDALESIYKTRQRVLFTNMMRRVQPREEVQAIRENILIAKMKKLDDQVISACSRSFLPKEMQTYLKVKDLKQRREEIQQRVEEQKREYDTLAGSVKAKNIQMMSLENNNQTLQARVNLLEFKSAALHKDIEKEDQIKTQIVATMPVKLTAKNAKENLAFEAVDKALKELDIFYNLCNNNNSHQLQEAKDELWRKIRTIFTNMPNFMIFNEILRRKEEQLQHIMSLNKSNLEETTHAARSLVGSAGVGGKEAFSTFDMKLMKSKVDLLGLVAKYLAARGERVALEERFYGAYSGFIDALQKKVKLFNAVDSEDAIDEVISDYVIQYNLCNFSKSQNDFIAQQIELVKSDIDTNAKSLENHEVLLGSVKQVYSDINVSINRIQYEVLQLGQIKEKILYSRNMMKHMLDADMQSAASGRDGAVKSNRDNLTTGDSFDAELMLCSTKLDFDGSMLSLNNTTLRIDGGNGGGSAPPLPPFVQELCAFTQLPLEKFSCIPNECAFYLSPNPLVVESRTLLSSTVQLSPGILLTPFGVLQEVRDRIAWSALVDAHSNDLKTDVDLIKIDPQTFRQKSKQQSEHIAELLDKIDVTGINTKHKLQKARKIYEFMLENSLRHYIPATKTFNNLTYAEFEAEFTMYYRMATVGLSIPHK